MMHWQGLTKLNGLDYTPLALVNDDPAGLQVRADSPYKTAKDLLDARQGEPRQDQGVAAPARAASGIWRSPACCSRWASIRQRSPWVPSEGAAPGLQDLVAGGVEIVPCSLPEARSLIDAGKVRSLADHGDKRSRALPERADAEGGDRHRLDDRARGAASSAPKGLPKDVADKLARRAREGLQERGVQRLHGAARLRRELDAVRATSQTFMEKSTTSSAR